MAAPTDDTARTGRGRSWRRFRPRIRGHPGTLVRRGLAVALFLLAAVLAAYPVTADGEPTKPMLVAAQDVPLGTTLHASHVKVVRVPDHARPAGVLTEPGAIEGKTLVGTARSGEPLTDVRVVGSQAAPPGAATVPVRLADAGIARLLRPGVQVDVVTVGDGAGGEKVLVNDVRVLTVIDRRGTAREGPAGKDAPLVLLAVPSADAAGLAAASLGQPVTITLR